MPTLTFIQHDGTVHTVQAEIGQSVMHAALNNQIPGVLGDCGGSCSCATCHGYVEPGWDKYMPAAEPYETDMLSCASNVEHSSRLTCQITITPELDGLIIRLPVSQT